MRPTSYRETVGSRYVRATSLRIAQFFFAKTARVSRRPSLSVDGRRVRSSESRSKANCDRSRARPLTKFAEYIAGYVALGTILDWRRRSFLKGIFSARSYSPRRASRLVLAAAIERHSVTPPLSRPLSFLFFPLPLFFLFP